ncbi:MAG: class I tRNA ligase family protein, partial [Clostridiales bacterium]|nr:class I tRNA ligase family protein [Clostridiales bacterium]
SALWPFATLGWPENTAEFEQFYPTSVLVTAYDIIFFWVIRMVFSGIEQTGRLPFKDVFIHGLMRDAQGRKMSKSLGNGIEPLEIIGQYGADALRLMIVTGNAAGNDMRFHMEKLDASRNFLNKLWNATRFILMNFDEEEPVAALSELTAADRWILSRVNALNREMTANIDHYELGIAVQKCYDFVWDEFCDWYIEMVKPRLYNKDDETRSAALWTLKTVIVNALKLLHPFMPFITEEIFTSIQSEEETIMLSAWPVYREDYHFAKEEKEIELIKEAVKGIRNLRAEMNVPPSKKSKIIIVSASREILDIFYHGRAYMMTLGYANDMATQADKTGIDEDAVSVILKDAIVYIPFAELVDIKKEIERLEKETAKLQKEVDRVEQKLNNPGFVAKAPADVIAEEKEKADKYRTMLAQATSQLETRRGKTN